MHGGMEQGDTVAVMIKNCGDEFVSADSNRTYRIFLDTDPEIATGDVGEISGAVTKVIYGKNNELQMLFIDNGVSTNVAEGTPKLSSSEDRQSALNDPKVRSNEAPSSKTRERRADDDATRSAPDDNQHPDDSLDAIAEDLIGDMEFDLDEEDESIVSDAKRRAREQQRDPAIDPKLNDT